MLYISTDVYMYIVMPEEYADNLDVADIEYNRIVKEVPEIEKFNYADKLRTALYTAKIQLNPDNPFLKVKGNYNFDIDTTGSSKEKTEYIHKKVTDYLMEQTGKIFTFKPGDNSKIYVLGEEGKSYKVSRMLQDAPNDIKKLLTQYPQTKKTKVTIRISTDPLDIVKKSTDQSWEHESCECIGGAYCQGIFSDIENNNAIAYIYLDNDSKPAGRFMLRWCNTPEKKADIGIESVMYPHTSYALLVHELIRGIIKSKGYGTYDECTTPYIYKGYSDYLGGSGVIKYKSGSSDEILIQYATMPEISRNMALALAEHTTPTNVRRALAENSKVCDIEDAVNKLSKDIDDDTKINLINTCSGRSILGIKNQLTEKAINNLINDNEDVKIALAQQIIDVPESIYEKIANDKSHHVRSVLARNKAIECCDNIINKLAADYIPNVREELINSNVKLTEKAESILADDIEFHSGIDYKEVYNATPDRFALTIKEDSERIHSRLAHKAKYPSTVRKLLDKKEGNYIRKEIALNKVIACCDDVIEKLANDKPEIAVNLLKNEIIDKPTRKKVIDTIIQKISDDYKEDIGDKFTSRVENKNTIYMHLAEQPEVCDYPKAIDEIMKSVQSEPTVYKPTDQAILYLAANPCISKRPDIIRKIVNESNVHVSQNLASNPSIEVTPDVVEKLYNKDNNPSIQTSLLENPAIIGIKNIKDKLINRIDVWTNKLSLSKLSAGNLSNIAFDDIAYHLSKNPKLYEDTELFNKLYETSKKNILAFNKHIFEFKDVVESAINDPIDRKVIASNQGIVNQPKIIEKLIDLPDRDVHHNLYEWLSKTINSEKRKGTAKKDMPEYILNAHKKLYYKLYPNQYDYEDAFDFVGWENV